MSVSCPTLHHDLRKIEIHSPILNVWDRFAEHAAPCLSRSFRPESQKRRWRFKPERFYTYWKFLRVFTQLPIKWTYDFNLSLRLYGVLSGNTCWKIFEAFGNVGLLNPGLSGNPTVTLNPHFFPSSGQTHQIIPQLRSNKLAKVQKMWCPPPTFRANMFGSIWPHHQKQLRI